jgi:putative addiction module killer protein
MFDVRLTQEFSDWLSSIKDGKTKARLGKRLRKAEAGNLGDTKPVGDGVMEMREHFGPGWRMYYVQMGNVVVVMLGGGDKSSQAADITAAKKLAENLEE